MAKTMACVLLLTLLVLPAVLVDAQSLSFQGNQNMEAEINGGRGEPAPAPQPGGRPAASCTVPDSSEKIPLGGQKQPKGKCLLYKCQKKGKNLVTVTHSCVVVKPAEGCDVKEQDPSLPYPKCCPVTRCSKGRK